MKEKIKSRAKQSAFKFKREFQKSLTTAIVAGFGFLIALTWRDFITEWVDKILEMSPVKNSLVIAIIITVVSVFGILIISKFNNEKK